MSHATPNYRRLSEADFRQKIDRLRERYGECDLCAHVCGVDRTAGELGRCRADDVASVSSAFPHFGEESPLSGRRGSGTVFLAQCSLRCVFCQNYETSQEGFGEKATPEEIAEMALTLQSKGCHNVNFVTPTHYAPDLAEAVKIARDRGLEVPIVWNCGGYERAEVVELLDGIVDVYMPDVKWADDDAAARYSGAPDYWSTARESLCEMHRQVGDLRLEDGLAVEGLLVRHLVMPNHVDSSKQVVSFVAEELSKETYLNVMSQYRPAYRVTEEGHYDELSRGVRPEEYREVVSHARDLGLTRLNVDERLL